MRSAGPDFPVLILTARLASIPFLTWFLVTWGLAPTRQLAKRVAQRNPNRLEQIETGAIPAELGPLVESLNTLLARLEHALENERRFTSDAAHEIRTPLAGLKIQAQVALGTRNDVDRVQALEQINHAVDRTMRLVEQLLSLARFDSALPDQNAQSVNLNAATAEVIAEITPQAAARGIEVSLT